MYSGFTFPDHFTSRGIDCGLFAYGAMFADAFQTAAQAVADNTANHGYSIYTNWQLNPADFQSAQTQQQALYQLVIPAPAAV